MALLSNSLYWLVAIIFFFGQLIRPQLLDINFPIIDFALAILVSFCFIYYIKYPKHLSNRPWQIFLIFSWISFIYNLLFFKYPFFKSFFYQIRLNLLLLLFILPKPKFTSNHPFIIIIFANILFGLLQYFFWPDSTAFKSLNWDPHLYRLISTFFDPTFTGLIFLMFLIYLFFNFYNFPILVTGFLLLVTYFAMALTYSRSTFLSFIVVFTFLAFVKKNIKLFFYPLILISLTIIFLPRLPGEGTKLERTSSISAKIQNYQEGFQLFNHFQFLGTGYNFLPNIRRDVDSNSHAIGGFDSSLVTILITNGILGFPMFILGLYQLFKTSTLTKKVMIVAILIHSLFANSLLYPWTLLFLYLI